jgi:N-acetylglucosamine-6-phosphate deacetylase
MLYYNANIYQPGVGFRTGSFETGNGRFQSVSFDKKESGSGVDIKGDLVIPGLIDIHTHGNSGYDFSDGDKEGLEHMGRYLLSHGVTGFMPTSMTLPYSKLEKCFKIADELKSESNPQCAEIVGIHMEGPFLSEKRKGAQNASYLRNPDIETFCELQKASGGLIGIVDIAPELEQSTKFIENVTRDGTIVSLAHTDADYNTAKEAFDKGATHVTHLFNGMPGLHHRNPGVIGAAAERGDVYAELICDGVHVHPAVIRMAFMLFPHRICLISDAIRCCGMPYGEYELGGQAVTVKEGEARLHDGTLAGSNTNLFECMKKAISFGIPIEEAVEAASSVPARCLGIDDKKGNIQVGNDADFVVCDKEMNIKEVYKHGERVYAYG